MLIWIFIGIVILFWGAIITSTAIDIKRTRELDRKTQEWLRGTKELLSEVQAEQDKYDADGHRKEYDPHYARKLEEEQGLRITVQCEDTNCTKCYWKARKLNDYWTGDFPPGSDILSKRQTWIKEQVDGLSDELYDMLYEDWLKEVAAEIDQAKHEIAQRRELKKRKEEENFYSTPYDQVQLYKAQGRTYNRAANAWSNPKVESGTSDAARSVTARNKIHWQERHPDYAPINPKPVGNQTVVSPEILEAVSNLDIVVDMYVTDVYDMPNDKINRIMTTTFASGKKAVMQKSMSYKEWKHDHRNK